MTASEAAQAEAILAELDQVMGAARREGRDQELHEEQRVRALLRELPAGAVAAELGA